MIWHLDWVSSVIAVTAIYTIGKRKWWGWLLNFVNSSC